MALPAKQVFLQKNYGEAHSNKSPRSQNYENYTGWPWSERHEYTTIQAENSPHSPGHSSRAPAVGQEEDGINRTEGGVLNFCSSHRFQQAVVVVLFLNAMVIILEAIFLSVPEAKFVLKLFELGFTMAFLILITKALRAEATKLSEVLVQKQATAAAAINEETMHKVRGGINSLREMVLDKEAFVYKDLRGQLTRAELIASEARTEAINLRLELEATQVAAEGTRLIADAANERVIELEQALASIQSHVARLTCETTKDLQVPESYDITNSNEIQPPIMEEISELPILDDSSFEATKDSVKATLDENWTECLSEDENATAGDGEEIIAATDKTLPAEEDSSSTEPVEIEILPDASNMREELS